MFNRTILILLIEWFRQLLIWAESYLIIVKPVSHQPYDSRAPVFWDAHDSLKVLLKHRKTALRKNKVARLPHVKN